jgi:DNA-binding protein YbaB
MTCDYRVTSVKLSKEAVDPDDVETLEDLLVVAVNDAVAKAQEASAKRMNSVTGGLRIPGLM